MRKLDLHGAGAVFRYTVQQHYKTKSVLIFLAFLLVASVAAFPLIAKLSGGSKEITETAIERLYVRNETEYVLEENPLSRDARYQNTEYSLSNTPDESLVDILSMERNSAAAVISYDEANGRFRIHGYYGVGSFVTSADVATIGSILEDALHDAVLNSLDVTPEQAQIVASGAYSQVSTVQAYKSGDDRNGADAETHTFVNMFYAYVILFLSSLAMSYIFQLCMEEKVNRLVESLLVSVSPVAMLVGKVLAVTLFLAVGLGLVGGGLCISWNITGNLGILDAVKEALAHTSFGDISTPSLHISLAILPLLVLCLMLAYFFCAFFSGIVGSCCSKPEDSQHASLAVVMFLMVGYMCGTMIPMAESDAANIFCTLFPLTSIFTALPNYICGKVNVAVFILGLLLQAASVVFLAVTAGRVYQMMILYRGEFPKPKQVIQMLKEARAAEKASAGKEDAQ